MLELKTMEYLDYIYDLSPWAHSNSLSEELDDLFSEAGQNEMVTIYFDDDETDKFKNALKNALPEGTSEVNVLVWW